MKKEGTIKFNSDDDTFTLKSVYHVPEMNKKLFLVANSVDVGHYVLFVPEGVKFFRNISSLKTDVINTGKRVHDSFNVEKMSTNDGSSI